jgi:hypothetical protein
MGHRVTQRDRGEQEAVRTARQQPVDPAFAVSWAWDFGPVAGREALLEEVYC